MDGERGFTILEVAVAGALFAVVLGTAVASVSMDTGVQRVLTADLGPEMRANSALERIASELRMASTRGEDRNGNGVMDKGEDINENGYFDADWDLADGAKDRPELTLNRRMDIRFADGDRKASGVYSRSVTFRLEGDRLVRYAHRTNLAGGEDSTFVTVIAQGISGLRFSRDGSLVTVSIDAKLPAKIYKTDRRTFTTRIALRN